MKNIELKNMTTERRRNYLLHSLQIRANLVLWSIRDNDDDVMIDIKRYRDMYRIYRNIKTMLDEKIYNSPRVDCNVIYGDWEDY